MQSPFYYKFVNSGFNDNPSSIFFSSPAFVSYPDATWGIVTGFYPYKRILTKLAAYVAQPDVSENKYHGFYWAFNGEEGLFLITEWSYLVNQLEEDTDYPGNYRVAFYYVTDQKGSKFLGGEFHGDWGYYLLLDQMIYRPEGREKEIGLTPFLALVFAPQDRNIFPFFISAGLVYQGLILSRPKDTTNLGWIYALYSRDQQKRQRLARKRGLLGPYGNVVQNFEAILEFNHWFEITPWFHLVPDIQYIYTSYS